MDYYVEFKVNSLTRKLELLKIDPPATYSEQMFYNESLFMNVVGTKDYCVCHCERNYGKRCLDADAYLKGGCGDTSS